MDIRRNFRIGELNFNLGTKQEAVDLIDSLSTSDVSPYILFWGGPMAVEAYRNKQYQEIEKKSTLCLADGQPIISAAKKAGMTNIERCGGPDVMELILKQGVHRNRRHFFYGTTDETLSKLQEELKKKYPGIKIVGAYSPPFRQLSDQEDRDIVEMINRSQPDYLWVALGAPKQELWCMEHCKQIKGARLMAVGAAFNFFAGTVKRAPLWVQKIGMEWFYRICQEPKHLWKRYILSGPQFLKLSRNDIEILEENR